MPRARGLLLQQMLCIWIDRDCSSFNLNIDSNYFAVETAK